MLINILINAAACTLCIAAVRSAAHGTARYHARSAERKKTSRMPQKATHPLVTTNGAARKLPDAAAAAARTRRLASVGWRC